MTQLNILSSEIGWGPLQKKLARMEALKKRIGVIRNNLKEEQENLSSLFDTIENERRKRVLFLLTHEGRVICLLHSLVFRESRVDEWLVPKDNTEVIVMERWWRTTHSYYDSDRWTEDHRESYESVACTVCRDILSHSSVDDGKKRHTRTLSTKPKIQTCAELYTKEMIDKISLEYFQMTPLKYGDLQLLYIPNTPLSST